MTVKDFLDILHGGIPTVRIIDINVQKKDNYDNNGVMACDFLDNFLRDSGEWAAFYDCEVKHFNVSHEIYNKKYKELGLRHPYRPDLPQDYENRRLNLKLYYDIHIDGATAGENWNKQEDKEKGK